MMRRPHLVAKPATWPQSASVRQASIADITLKLGEADMVRIGPSRPRRDHGRGMNVAISSRGPWPNAC